MPIERFEIDTDQWAVVPLVPSKRQLEAAAFNLCNNFGAEFVQANEAFARSVYLEFLLAAVQPKPKDDKPVIPDFVFDVIQQAKDSICAGGLAENAQHERSIVEPYLDGIIDELLAAAPRPEPVQPVVEFPPPYALIEIDVDTGIRVVEKPSHKTVEVFSRKQVLALLSAQQPAQPIPTGERLPTKADADCFGKVWARMVVEGKFHMHPVKMILSVPDAFDFWLPTGLTRPAEPGGNGDG